MPLRNDLLNPISPDRPAGENLWYSPTYDKIKEARREDDDAPQGDMTFERKVADWPLTIKLIGEALATKTKDLQLAVWLAEAMLRREGVAGLRETLDLIRGLIENFWDGLYPEMEDGDAEFRASPLRWLGERQVKLDRMSLGVKSAPLTKGGFNWIQFRESRKVGTEAAADTYEKQRVRQEALDEGKIAEEVFDKDFDSTPKKFYVDLEATFDGALESLDRLSQICDEKFGECQPLVPVSARGARGGSPDGAHPAGEEARDRTGPGGSSGSGGSVRGGSREGGRKRCARQKAHGPRVGRTPDLAGCGRPGSGRRVLHAPAGPLQPSVVSHAARIALGRVAGLREDHRPDQAGRAPRGDPPDSEEAGSGCQLDGRPGNRRECHGHGVRERVAGSAALLRASLLRIGRILRGESAAPYSPR